MDKPTRRVIPLEHIVQVYSDLFNEIWQRVAGFIGDATLQVLMKSAVNRVASTYPFMAVVQVTNNSLILDSLEEGEQSVPSLQMQSGLQGLVAELFSILTAMSGNVIIRELSPKIRESEVKLTSYQGDET
jgi:hypothetical protein